MTDSERMLHGRLVGRLTRQLGKIVDKGSTPLRRRKVLHTVQMLILVERKMADPLSRDRVVTAEQMRDRVNLMKPGAGIEVPS